MDNSFANTAFKWLLGLAITVLVARLISLGFYPLYDTTEARYGEIARIMVETNNWVTPQFDYNVPFWGKPPFQTWISAASFQLFGINEFAARLPHYCCGLITLLLCYSFLTQFSGRKIALTGCIILPSTLSFVLASGTVMTDSALLMATTLAMVSYWRCYSNHHRFYNGLVFFAALSLGMLIKGPVAIVIVGIALLVWSLYQRCFIDALKCLPWISGLTLFLALTLPWYIWAEIRSPGFIEYFIIGEHFQRFLVSGWQGDLYGTAHRESRGMIWIFWLACAFPWSFIIIQKTFNFLRSKRYFIQKDQPASLATYFMCWMLAPLFLFSLSGNILPAYVLPGISAMALFVAVTSKNAQTLAILATIGSLLLLLVIGLVSSGKVTKSSESDLLSPSLKTIGETPLYYWDKRPFSAQFYSNGHAKLLTSKKRLINLINDKGEFYLAMTHTQSTAITPLLAADCESMDATRSRILLRCNAHGH